MEFKKLCEQREKELNEADLLIDGLEDIIKRQESNHTESMCLIDEMDKEIDKLEETIEEQEETIKEVLEENKELRELLKPFISGLSNSQLFYDKGITL